MKTLTYISVLLMAASTLLPSCTLLASSPLPHSRPHHYSAHHVSGDYMERKKVYNGIFRVPAKGGVYEFKCADDQFYIARIFDSSMQLHDPLQHSNCRCAPSTDVFKPINDVTYDGPFYSITCDKDQHKWIITFDPLTTMPGSSDQREVFVSMWDGSDDSGLVFLFEQTTFDSPEYIQ